MIPYQPETHLSTIAQDTLLHVSGPGGETGQPVEDAEAWSMITFHTKTHLSTIARAKLLVHDSLDTQHSSPSLSRQRTTITEIPNAGDIGNPLGPPRPSSGYTDLCTVLGFSAQDRMTGIDVYSPAIAEHAGQSMDVAVEAGQVSNSISRFIDLPVA